MNVPVGLRGMGLLDSPVWNTGTAFADRERAAFGLHGLLPPHVESLQEQSVRAYESFSTKKTDLGRHIYLRQLQDSNESRCGEHRFWEKLSNVRPAQTGSTCKSLTPVVRLLNIFVSPPQR
jgi:malate dehydrogenase (oxaloacetate-decarboxylating)